MGPATSTTVAGVVVTAGARRTLVDLEATSCSSATLGVDRVNLSTALRVVNQRAVCNFDFVGDGVLALVVPCMSNAQVELWP